MKPSLSLVIFSVLTCGVLACGGTSTPGTTPNADSSGSDEAATEELARAEELYEEFAQARIDCADQLNLENFIQCLQERVRLLSGSAMESVEAYQRVLERSSAAPSTLASLTGQARTFARMVQILNEVEVPEIYPTALLEEGARMSDEARQAVQEQVHRNIRGVLETQSAPIACTAVVYDVMALRLAQSLSINTEYSQESVTRLSASSDEQISECVEQGRTSDETLEAYSPGELDLQR